MAKHGYPVWIVTDKNQLAVLCERCLKSAAYKRRQTLTSWKMILREFVAKHRDCKEKDKMSDKHDSTPKPAGQPTQEPKPQAPKPDVKPGK